MATNRSVGLFLISLILLIMTSCNSAEGNNKVDYDQTKKMVVDILKTDEGRKAIEEVIKDERLKEQLVLEQPIVLETIEKTLMSEKGYSFWKKSFSNHKFAESFANSMSDEHEKLFKNLMNDPDYRGKMFELLKDPEFEKNVLNLLKSKEYRTHLQTVIIETFQNPLFQAKIEEILIDGAEQLQKGKSKSGKDESEEEDQADGDDEDGKDG